MEADKSALGIIPTPRPADAPLDRTVNMGYARTDTRLDLTEGPPLMTPYA
jgi:hypothetical protein